MSTLWKFFARDSKSTDGPKCNGNFHPLRPELQKRFANGVKYNMKLVIRGDRRTGKTALFTRLKGEPFSSDYTATDEIQVSFLDAVFSPARVGASDAEVYPFTPETLKPAPERCADAIAKSTVSQRVDTTVALFLGTIVACILWGYKETDEVVKVEVWDVVDKGKPRNLTQGTKLPRYARKFIKEAQVGGALKQYFLSSET
ncbi:unnamed protein product [Dibothriocephalus latus]|uniref:Uncharacterized protein n=1 Tax=Dibothriocephalus latus TaxID=60516 RepID=A0A3P7MGW5_DIBLA|nr:unnamed protein product [Dibothriocephalus latus]